MQEQTEREREKKSDEIEQRVWLSVHFNFNFISFLFHFFTIEELNILAFTTRNPSGLQGIWCYADYFAFRAIVLASSIPK